MGVINLSSSMIGEFQMAALTLEDEGCIIQHIFFYKEIPIVGRKRDRKIERLINILIFIFVII